jgi:hypothetical protein
MAAEIQEQLGSSAKLERDKAFAELQKLIVTLDLDAVIDLQNDFLRMLGEPSDRWESRHGALSGCKALIESAKSDDDFAFAVLNHALESLDDSEFRVRIVAGNINKEILNAFAIGYISQVHR